MIDGRQVGPHISDIYWTYVGQNVGHILDYIENIFDIYSIGGKWANLSAYIQKSGDPGVENLSSFWGFVYKILGRERRTYQSCTVLRDSIFNHLNT